LVTAYHCAINIVVFDRGFYSLIVSKENGMSLFKVSVSYSLLFEEVNTGYLFLSLPRLCGKVTTSPEQW
jgi:hypothetical protein